LFSDYGVTRGGTLTLSIPLFDWGSNSLDIQSARILHTNAVHSFENTEQQIRLEISDLVSRIQLAESRIQLLEKVVAVAEKGYAISLERFKTGTASRNDLAQSQQRLTNAKLNNLNALIDYQIAIADLRRRTLWDFEQKEPINPKWYPESAR
jgi:outer membrane protein